MQTLMLLVERQPAAAPKVLRLLVLTLSLENEGLAQRALEQLLDLLEAGGSRASPRSSRPSWRRSCRRSAKTDALARSTRSRSARARALLRALQVLAEEGEGRQGGDAAARADARAVAQREGAVGGGARRRGLSCCKDKKTALELRDERVPKRVIALLQSRETKQWPHSRRLQLLRIVRVDVEERQARVRRVLQGQRAHGPAQRGGRRRLGPRPVLRAKSAWVAQLVSTIDAPPHTRERRATRRSRAATSTGCSRSSRRRSTSARPLLTACCARSRHPLRLRPADVQEDHLRARRRRAAAAVHPGAQVRAAGRAGAARWTSRRRAAPAAQQGDDVGHRRRGRRDQSLLRARQPRTRPGRGRGVSPEQARRRRARAGALPGARGARRRPQGARDGVPARGAHRQPAGGRRWPTSSTSSPTATT